MPGELDMNRFKELLKHEHYAGIRELADRVLESVDDPSYRSALARVVGREAEFLRDELLPEIPDPYRSRMLDLLARDEALDWWSLLLILYLIPHHRPQELAIELLKPHAEKLELKILGHVLDYLQPEQFFSVHLSGAALARLRHKAASLFEKSEAGCRTLPELLAAIGDVQDAGTEIAAALDAYRGVLERPAALDYGCSRGGLVGAFAAAFEAHGGDIPGELPGRRLERALVCIRSHRDAGGYLKVGTASDRYVALDPTPNEDSPPADGSFSVVTSNGVLEHIMDDECLAAVVGKMCRLLRPGGALVINCLPTWLGYDPHHLLSPWWGIVLHRSPRKLRQAMFGERWNEGFCRRVELAKLVRMLPEFMLPPRVLFASHRRGALGTALRFSAGLGLAPWHYLLVPRRCDTPALD